MNAESLNKPARTVTDPFRDFQPVLWYPEQFDNPDIDGIYSIKRNHGIASSFKLHNPNDAINDDRTASEKIVIEYNINECSYPLFTAADLLNTSFPYDENSAGNLLGEIAERISRRITKYFLKHWSKRGRTGGIFDQRFDPQHREDFIVAHSNDYILKIQQYPNLIILKRTGRGKYGYENIKELDGFFDYRYQGQRHILVLESKLEKINVDCDDLVKNLFTPLRHIFPEARFHYVLFTDRHSIYVKNTYSCWRQIKQLPVKIHERLNPEGIGTLFFTFNESRDDYERMKDFLITQYRAVRKLGVTLHGKTVISEKELIVFDGGETPHIKLVKDLLTGHWREMPLRHKRHSRNNLKGQISAGS